LPLSCSRPSITAVPFIHVFQDLIDAAAAGEPSIDDASARLHGFFAESIANAGQNAWFDKTALILARLIAVA
jgi:hypothetical protein